MFECPFCGEMIDGSTDDYYNCDHTQLQCQDCCMWSSMCDFADDEPDPDPLLVEHLYKIKREYEQLEIDKKAMKSLRRDVNLSRNAKADLVRDSGVLAQELKRLALEEAY